MLTTGFIKIHVFFDMNVYVDYVDNFQRHPIQYSQYIDMFDLSILYRVFYIIMNDQVKD